jgi:hypothetical protein
MSDSVNNLDQSVCPSMGSVFLNPFVCEERRIPSRHCVFNHLFTISLISYSNTLGLLVDSLQLLQVIA